MDEALKELYQEVILEHNRALRNKFQLPLLAKFAQGYNPSCGDDMPIFVEMKDNIIRNITFDGEGCAISQASASLMTEILVGRSKQKAIEIIDSVCSVLSDTNGVIQKDNPLEQYGKVVAPSGVRKFPMRIKCATLAWHATTEAISIHD
jgi:nitrogen fixation NifU-like protein